MWQPKRIGQVIAEREIDFRSKTGRLQRVRLKIGLPVRDPGFKVGYAGPYYCPIQVKGAGLDFFRPIAGEDTLQALILALEFLSDVLPSEAIALGGHVSWLGDSERIILGRHALSRATQAALLVLVGNLKVASGILDGSHSGTARKRAMRALYALAELGGLPHPYAHPPPTPPKKKKRKTAGRAG